MRHYIQHVLRIQKYPSMHYYEPGFNLIHMINVGILFNYVLFNIRPRQMITLAIMGSKVIYEI